MPAIVNVGDFVKVGIMAFIAVWAINKALKTAGLNQYAV